MIHIYSVNKTKNKKAELIKFRYNNERLWLLVTKETEKYDYGAVDNKPTEKGLNYGDKKMTLTTEHFYILYK